MKKPPEEGAQGTRVSHSLVWWRAIKKRVFFFQLGGFAVLNCFCDFLNKHSVSGGAQPGTAVFHFKELYFSAREEGVREDQRTGRKPQAESSEKGKPREFEHRKKANRRNGRRAEAQVNRIQRSESPRRQQPPCLPLPRLVLLVMRLVLLLILKRTRQREEQL